jgi:HEAT repeat protein
MAKRRTVSVLDESIRQLNDGDRQAKVEAMHALGRLDDPRGIPALVAVLRSADADLRAMAMGKLAFLNSPRIVPAVLRALDDPEPRVRQHALFTLQRMKVRSAADRMARMMLGDADKLVRFNAALALTAVAAPRHAAAFVRALADEHNDIVLTAFQALAALKPRDLSRHVLAFIGNAKRWAKVPEHQRDLIVRFLKGSLNQTKVLALLRRMTRDGIAAAQRMAKPSYAMEVMEAACLLAEAGDATGAPVLRHALSGGEYSQERAMRGLALLKDTSAVPLIIAKPLENPFFPITLKAVRALGQIGDVRALPALARIFNGRGDDLPADRSVVFTKDDPDLRRTTLEAMARIIEANLR